MRRKMAAWAVFVSCFLLLTLGATRFWKAADLALMSVSAVLVVLFSVLVVREKWKGHPAAEDELNRGRFRRLVSENLSAMVPGTLRLLALASKPATLASSVS